MKLLSFTKRSPVARAAVIASLAFVSLQCIKMPLEPITPAADIQLSIPLIDRTRTVADLMSKDSSKVKQNSAGYYYEDDRTFKPVGIDTIKVSPQSSTNQVGVGILTVPGLPAQNSSVTASQLFPGPFPVSVPGPPAPSFPATSTTVAGQSMQDTTDFDFLRISTGTMGVSVTNTLPMDITFTRPLVIRNNKLTLPIDTSVVAVFNLGVVTSGQTVSVSSNLAGILMRGALRTDSISISTASKQGPFTINSTDGFSLGISTTSLEIDSASAKIPQQNLVSINDSTITLDPTAVLQQALFSKGQFTLNVNNQTGLTVGARMKFSNFVKSIAPFDTLTIDTTLTGHQLFSLNVALPNYRVVNGSPNGPGTSLKFSVGIKTVTSGNQKATVTYKDFVNASFVPQQQFVLKSLTGIMNPMTVNINAGVGMSGLGSSDNKFSGSFSYDSVQIRLNFGLSSGYPIYHNLKLFAIKGSGPTAKIDSLTIPPNTIQPSLSTPGIITLGNAQGLNTFLAKITPNLPDSFIVRGSVIVNPAPPKSGTIYDTTKIYPSISSIIPLKLGLLGGQYVDVAPNKGKFDSAFVASTKRGTLYLSITNGLPLTLTFRAAFIGMDTITHKRDTLLAIPLGASGSTIRIAGANVDNSGQAVSANTSTFNISLVTQQIQAISASDSSYIRLTLDTSGSAGPPVQPVRIRSTDFITIRASASMVYTVNKK